MKRYVPWIIAALLLLALIVYVVGIPQEDVLSQQQIEQLETAVPSDSFIQRGTTPLDLELEGKYYPEGRDFAIRLYTHCSTNQAYAQFVLVYDSRRGSGMATLPMSGELYLEHCSSK